MVKGLLKIIVDHVEVDIKPSGKLIVLRNRSAEFAGEVSQAGVFRFFIILLKNSHHP